MNKIFNYYYPRRIDCIGLIRLNTAFFTSSASSVPSCPKKKTPRVIRMLTQYGAEALKPVIQDRRFVYSNA